jgi:serine/threonine protein kinase
LTDMPVDPAADEPPPTFDVLSEMFEVDPDPIGLGTFGSVHFALNNSSGKTVAIKAISKVRTQLLAEAAGQEASVHLETELAEEMGAKKHRNILRFYGSWEDARYLYVATQLCAGGELPDWLVQQEEAYCERVVARVAYDVLQALAFVHDTVKVVHRDVKPQNLMFTEPTPAAFLKLIDFGLATRWDGNEEPPLTEVCGTIDFMAPEILASVNGKRGYGDRVDVWAAGVIMYMMLSGKHPFRGPSRAATEAR